MTISDNTFNYDQLYNDVEDVFQGHGQDIVLRNDTEIEGQPWGTPELLIPVFVVLIWILETTGRTIIEALVKKFFEKKEPDTIAELENRVRQLELLLEQIVVNESISDVSNLSSYLRQTTSAFKAIKNQHKLNPVVSSIQAHKELSACLVRIGFTHRKSKLLASQIIRMLPLTTLKEPHEDA